MRFHYKSLRVTGEESVGSGRGYVVKQTSYDLKSVQDHTVDVPLWTVFVAPENFTGAGCLSMIFTIPLGLVAVLVRYGRVPGWSEALLTAGAVFLACTLLLHLIISVKSIRTTAEIAVLKQRNTAVGEKTRLVPAEEWDAFMRSINASTTANRAQAARFDAVARHAQQRDNPGGSSGQGG